MKKPFMISITGGSGSGKTSLARMIRDRMPDHVVAILTEDDYYHSLDHLKPGEPLPNFDHPDAKDLDLLSADVARAVRGESFQSPCYDFVTHRRVPGGTRIPAADVVILEGMHHMLHADIRRTMDMALFVDCPAALRLDRRIRRDQAERAIDEAESRRMFAEEVTPMHDRYVEPQKQAVTHVVENVTDTPAELDRWADACVAAARAHILCVA